MSLRFATNLLVLIASGFVVVSTQAFDAVTAGWIAFVKKILSLIQSLHYRNLCDVLQIGLRQPHEKLAGAQRVDHADFLELRQHCGHAN